MRRRTILLLLLIAAGLMAAAGHFWLGWWRPPQPDPTISGGGYNAQSEPATLTEVLREARDAIAEIQRNVHDYSGFILKRERVGNQIVKKWMFIKFREPPFSVYLYYPDASKLDGSNEGIAGREVIYVDGRNDNKLLVHSPGLISGALGTMHLAPDGFLAMKGERHPITDIGLANLCRQLIQRGEAAGDPALVQVKRYAHARINSRVCSLLEVTYPANEKGYWGYLARIFVDSQWHFPTRVEVYGLPRNRKQEPQLVEEYTYLDLKLNNGYTDADFDPKNRQYHFP
jgi:hypothetical protein